MRNVIKVSGIDIYAYHGCLDEEARIGGKYTVDIEIECNYKNSFETDDLSDTIDYCQVYEIVRHEMSIRSKLIEHVANRILLKINSEVKQDIESVLVRVIKHNPPMNGQVKNVSVEVSN